MKYFMAGCTAVIRFVSSLKKTDCYVNDPWCNSTVGSFRWALWMHFFYAVQWCIVLMVTVITKPVVKILSKRVVEVLM